MTKAIFIEWTEEEQVFEDWRVVSGLGCEPTFKAVTRVKSVRFSNEVTSERIAQANKYIETDRPEAKVVIK